MYDLFWIAVQCWPTRVAQRPLVRPPVTPATLDMNLLVHTYVYLFFLKLDIYNLRMHEYVHDHISW